MSTYVPIQAITLSSAAESITFSNIPQNYTDLVLVMKGVDLSGVDGRGDIQVGNGSVDTGSNYSRTGLSGNGSAASSYRGSNEPAWYVDSVSSSNGAAQSVLQIMNYSNTTTNKTAIVRSDSVNLHTRAIVYLWRNTAAINIITITSGSVGSTYQAGSTFTLYGVGTGSPKAFGGTTVVSDGTYWYHAFQSSGVFEPLENLTADVLVVAGGGGGSGVGGGGAGGLRSLTSQSFSATNYTVTVGGGGASTTKGNNSSIGSISATGGGRGNNVAGTPAATCNGGSGGGGSDSSIGGLGNQGGYSPVEGYNGGTASGVIGGGGGGAGAVGANAASIGGAGGIGATSALINAMAVATKTGELSGGNYYFASGGGGGYNGAGSTADSPGGGGVGKRDADATSTGLPNTGGGGGGIYNSGASFITGGSGIVIVRYLI